MKEEYKSFKRELLKSAKTVVNALPLIFGVVLLMGLMRIFISTAWVMNVFKGNIIMDTFIGSFLGSISAGHSMTSYILGGELLKKGVSLVAIVAFIIAWDTIGIVQIPIEVTYLGKRFTLTRNILCFIFSMGIAIAVSLTIWIIS